MKKIVFCFIVLAFALPLLAADGGPARLAGMGSPEVVVPDASSMLNLYEQGFGAAIFSMKKANSITLFPGLEYRLNKTVPKLDSSYTSETWYFGGGYGLSGNSGNGGLVAYVADDLAIVAEPYGTIMPGNYRSYRQDGLGTENKNTYLEYIYGGNFEVIKKVSGGLAVSGLLGYTSEQYLSNNDDYKYMNEFGIWKPEFEVSAAFLPDSSEGMTLAIKAGNSSVYNRNIPRTRGGLMLDEVSAEISIFTNGIYSGINYSEDSVTITKVAYFTDLYTYHLDAGLSSGSGDNVFSATLGLMASPGGRQYMQDFYEDEATGSKTSSDRVSEKMVDFELGPVFNMAYRAALGAFTAGVKLGVAYLHVAEPDNDGFNLFSTYDAAGISFNGIDGLKIPLEVYYSLIRFNSFDPGHYYSIDYGASLGAEISISSGFDLRLGTYAGMRGDGDENDDPIGTENNRGYFRTGASAGVGFKGTNMETNISVKWDVDTVTPMNDSLNSRGTNDIKLLSDIIIYL